MFKHTDKYIETHVCMYVCLKRVKEKNYTRIQIQIFANKLFKIVL